MHKKKKKNKCIYTYIYIRTCMHAYVHTYMHMYIMPAYIHTCMHIYIHESWFSQVVYDFPLAIFSSPLRRIVPLGHIFVILNEDCTTWPYFRHP